MKLLELIISIALFIVALSTTSFILFQDENILLGGEGRMKALLLAEKRLGFILEDAEFDFNDIVPRKTTSTISGMTVFEEMADVANFIKKIHVTVWYKVKDRKIPVTVSRVITDTSVSEGQSSCRPTLDKNAWKNLSSYIINLTRFGDIKPTSAIIKGNKLFISSDVSDAVQPDLYLFEINQQTQDVDLLSSINTGPGVNDIFVAGEYVYLANTSIDAQLQIVSVTGNSDLSMVIDYKLPGVYTDGTTIGNSIFYTKDFVFLGTQKSQVKELYAISVTNKSSPIVVGSYEINAGINDLFFHRKRLYVASPANEDIQMFRFEGTQLTKLDGYNGPGAGNGKSISVLFDHVYLGRTIGTKEVSILEKEGQDLDIVSSFNTGVSVHGVFAYGNLLFTLLNRTSDGFKIFDISSSTAQPLQHNSISFVSSPIAMTCDKDTFVVIEDGKRITIIKPAQ